jgi:hypothetical protein
VGWSIEAVWIRGSQGQIDPLSEYAAHIWGAPSHKIEGTRSAQLGRVRMRGTRKRLAGREGKEGPPAVEEGEEGEPANGEGEEKGCACLPAGELHRDPVKMSSTRKIR